MKENKPASRIYSLLLGCVSCTVFSFISGYIPNRTSQNKEFDFVSLPKNTVYSSESLESLSDCVSPHLCLVSIALIELGLGPSPSQL